MIVKAPRGTDGSLAGDGKTILVVEDDVDILAMLRFALEIQGYAVESAVDGLDALEKARRARPALVILDLNMPRMGGQDFLYAWRMGRETLGVPVVVITAESGALRPADLGVEAFFSKPFDVDALLWHVGDLLAIPSRVPGTVHQDPRRTEMADITDALGSVMTTLIIGIESLHDALDLPENLRTIATASLDAAVRASALGRRLNQLVSALK